MGKKIFFLSFLCLFICLFTAADEIDDNFSMDSELLFVSLGSVCEPAHLLRFCELRKAAFPFDWIISFDGETVIEMLKHDFLYFFDDEYFTAFGPAGHLLHTYYHLEFLHEGNFNSQFEEKLLSLKEKYQRRIERFRSLKDYPGKVIFLRCSYPYSMTDPHRFYHFKENLELSEEYTIRLFEALKKYFPDLDFHLVILNQTGSENFEQREIAPNIFLFKTPLIDDLQKKIEAYKIFFAELISRVACN